MKKLWIVGLVAAFIGAAPLAYAGCGHCAGSKKEASCSKGKDACSAWLKGITLSDEQKTKVDEIQKGCDGSKDACAKAKGSIRALLTEDQQKAFDDNAAKCEKKKGCCPDKGAA